MSGIIFVNRNGLRWREAPSAYGPHKTLYKRQNCWDEAGVFVRMMEGLAAADADPTTVMIDATYLKAHRSASRSGWSDARFAISRSGREDRNH